MSEIVITSTINYLMQDGIDTIILRRIEESVFPTASEISLTSMRGWGLNRGGRERVDFHALVLLDREEWGQGVYRGGWGLMEGARA